MPYVVVAAAIVALVAVVLLVRHRRRKRNRLIAFVALLREPIDPLEPTVLARVAGEAWDIDLGDGESEGADGLVASAGFTSIVSVGADMTMVNCFDCPYVDDVEDAASSISDLRIRSLFAEHKAWFSVDAMGVDRSTPEAEIKAHYRRLAKLFVELLDNNCLLIFLPDSKLAFPINDETEAALRSDDPIDRLFATLPAPFLQVDGDDPAMVKAVARAREDWPRFRDAYEAKAGQNFSVKAPITVKEITEFIWIAVTTIEGDRVYGTLANVPHNLGTLRLGSKVSVEIGKLNDWCFLDGTGAVQGGYTVQAVSEAAERHRKKSSN